MKIKQSDILIAGVGGQGQVLASRLLAAAAINSGLMVRTGETIGMSQRGGCVVSNVRIGESMGPSVPDGMADVIIGFELCETARNMRKLRPNGTVILNNQIIHPITVSLGFSKYDDEAMKRTISTRSGRVLTVDGMRLAAEAGNVKACNVVLLGAACGAGCLPFGRDALLEAICGNVPAKYKEVNVRAFESGFALAN